jgi:hypothetical protein
VFRTLFGGVTKRPGTRDAGASAHCGTLLPTMRLAYPLALAILLGACASSAPFTPSPHYATVTKHLDVGGQVLVYADVDGDLAAGAEYLDKLIEQTRALYPDLKLDRVSAQRILRQLGLDQVPAMGLSSSREGKIFHNRAFFEYGKERRGLLLMTGTGPRELEVVRQAPVDADLVFESDIKLKSLFDLIETIAKEIGGKESEALFAELDEQLPGTPLTLRQLIGHLDTRLVGVLRVDERRAFILPGNDQVQIPGFDLLLSADDLGVLFDVYQGMLRMLPNVKVSEDGDMQWIEIDAGIAGAPWLQPVLAKNAKTGRLFVATGKGFVTEYLADKKGGKQPLCQAADWKRATARFEAKANALTYMSGAFVPKVERFVRPLGKDDKELQMGIDVLLGLLPEAGIPFAAQQVNLADGLYYASYATTSHKSTIFSGLVAGPLVVAGAAAAVATSGLRDYLHASRDAPKGADAEKGPPAVEKTPDVEKSPDVPDQGAD